MRTRADEVKNKIDFKFTKRLVKTLLVDHTTNRNIIWATDDYKSQSIMPMDEILVSQVFSNNRFYINSRVRKTKTDKKNRTVKNAEVFTPSWICNKQNNIIDDAWFNKKNVFNKENGKKWITNKDKIVFQNERTWKDYVLECRMEIACGEAPYITSRYDTVTGEYIDFNNRIGIFDRKLRVINENIVNEKQWMKWVKIALQSTYGFEYQGDNLFLARLNIINSVIDSYYEKYKKIPSIKYIKDCAEIVAWNIWQMDGTTYKIPYDDVVGDEITLFNYDQQKEEHLCLIMDWKNKIKISIDKILK